MNWNVPKVFSYVKNNPAFLAGSCCALFLAFFLIAGGGFVSSEEAYPLAASASKAPSLDYPFGTDSQGRNLLAVAVYGTRMTLQIGFMAAAAGLFVGTSLGFIAAYFGGAVDTIIKWLTDVCLTIPELLILVVVVSSFGGESISVFSMAAIISLMSWRWPARVIRAQALTMKKQDYIVMAQLSGMGSLEIIFKEMVPNLLPFLGAAFAGSVRGAIFDAIGLSALGLGPLREPELGVTVYWIISQNAMLRGLWWWPVMPVVLILFVMVTLYLLTAGFDEIANPRLQKM